MPGIGSFTREIDVKIVSNLIKANKLLLSETSSHVLSVKLRSDNYVLTNLTTLLPKSLPVPSNQNAVLYTEDHH